MGFAKRQLERQHELGFSLTNADRPVCPECIEDLALREFVGRHAQIDRCGFCGQPGPYGTSLDALFEYMSGCLNAEFDDPLNEVGWDDGWAGAHVFDSDDLLIQLGDPLGHPDLREEFVLAFDREWCQANPYCLPYDEQLSYSWERFSEYVRTRSRYLFLRSGRQRDGDDPDLFEPSRVLDEVGKCIYNGDVVRTLPEGARLVRARAHANNELPATAAELGSPPVTVTIANRMSPAGISMFYGAEDAATALAELRHEAGDRATVAAWTTARELRYLDLARLSEVPSLFDQFARSRRPWLKFLRRFSVEIARPVVPGAGPVEYVPTQIFTEFIRDEILDQDGAPLKGIRYPSAVHPGGMCWVLFVASDGCGDHDGAVLRLEEKGIQRFEPSWQLRTAASDGEQRH